eukprot:COSAG06_NODE_55611_length_288_cov_2.814815_1_plen_39_part_01
MYIADESAASPILVWYLTSPGLIVEHNTRVQKICRDRDC